MPRGLVLLFQRPARCIELGLDRLPPRVAALFHNVPGRSLLLFQVPPPSVVSLFQFTPGILVLPVESRPCRVGPLFKVVPGLPELLLKRLTRAPVPISQRVPGCLVLLLELSLGAFTLFLERRPCRVAPLLKRMPRVSEGVFE